MIVNVKPYKIERGQQIYKNVYSDRLYIEHLGSWYTYHKGETEYPLKDSAVVFIIEEV